MRRRILKVLLQTAIVLTGTAVLMAFVSLCFGTLIYAPVKWLSSELLEAGMARRITRAIELFLYGCTGVIVFRYLARFFPLSCSVGKAMYGWLRMSIGVIAAVVAIRWGGLGTFSDPGMRLVPSLVFGVTLATLVILRLIGHTFLRPAGTVLFLRRFGSFADRSVVSSVLRTSPRGGNVTFLVASDEPASNWDPWSLGFAGFRLFYPLTSAM
jgi:hypothetical protein